MKRLLAALCAVFFTSFFWLSSPAFSAECVITAEEAVEEMKRLHAVVVDIKEFPDNPDIDLAIMVDIDGARQVGFFKDGCMIFVSLIGRNFQHAGANA